MMNDYKLICGYPQNDNITEEVANLQSQNAELLETLKAAKPWVAKCSADHDTDHLGIRAHRVLERIEATIAAALK